MKININIEADYYSDACPPFRRRKILREYEDSLGSTRARYLTTQHERDDETGLDYRGARFYDSDIGRFLSLDPLAAKFPSTSPYNYVLGNPIMLVDPDGKAPSNYGPIGDWNLREKVIKNRFPAGYQSSRRNSNSATFSSPGVGNYIPEQTKALNYLNRANRYTLQAGTNHIQKQINNVQNLATTSSTVQIRLYGLKIGDQVQVSTTTNISGAPVSEPAITINDRKELRKYRKISRDLQVNEGGTATSTGITTTNFSVTVTKTSGKRNKVIARDRIKSETVLQGIPKIHSKRDVKRRRSY